MSGALTIPQLELVAAALATCIACSVLQESKIKYKRIVYWSDSSATLHLIRNNTHRFFVFIDSCLAEIQESSCVQNWRYCPTNLNPSDVGTRLIAPKNRKKFLPWHGLKDLNLYYYQIVNGHLYPLHAGDQIKTAKSSSQLMAALPKERLIYGERAFYTTGCHFFGPIMVTEFRKKNNIGVHHCVFFYESCAFRSLL